MDDGGELEGIDSLTFSVLELVKGVLLTSAPGVAIVLNVNVSVVPNKTPNAAAVAAWVRKFREALSENQAL